MNYNYGNPYPNPNPNNYNMYPQNENLNAFSNPVPLCNLCKGSGFYLMNGMNMPCQCSPQALIQPTNYYYNYDEYPQGTIYSEKHHKHHPHHRNIFSKTFHAIKDCITCGGRGFMNASTRSGHQKVCYECIRASGYCPVCENTGYKIHNGRQCKCGLFN